jgi:Zn-dependent M28 family amino/carboxypeptidase
MGTSCENIIAKAGEGPVIVVGAGYDTRRQADQDPDPALREEPVPGANGSASGVAVLLELARTLNKSQLSNQVWLLFMDAEDNGGLDGWDPLAGAHFFADHLSTSPQAVIILDMIGYKNQQIYQERNSTPALQDEIFAIAAKLGYDAFFIPQYRWQVQDAHTAFLAHGWPATDIIDFDYPYWHTSHDTADEVSPDALGRVGRVLQAFLQKTS